MRGWYREVVDHDPPPARVTFKWIMMERVELYHALPPPPPPGDSIPTSVTPDHVDDSVSTEEEVKWAVQRLRGHRLGGTYRMRAKYLREWLREHQVTKLAA